MNYCKELLRGAEYMRQSGEKDPDPDTAEHRKRIAVMLDCLSYGLYAIEYEHGINVCED